MWNRAADVKGVVDVGTKSHFLQLLSKTRHALYSTPHDRIFALLGLLSYEICGEISVRLLVTLEYRVPGRLHRNLAAF